MSRRDTEASSNGRTADFGSAYEGSNPSASTSSRNGARPAPQRGEVKAPPRPERVLLVPLGPVPKGLLPEVAAALQEAFGCPSDAGPAQVTPDYAFNKDRHQYHSTAVLRRLEVVRGKAHPGPVLGVVDVDLFVPDQAFVFGEADRDARTALLSVHRLKGGDGRPVPPERLTHRARVEAIHEVGHVLGLSLCADFRCAMFLSHTAADADRKGAGLCAQCRAAVGRP